MIVAIAVALASLLVAFYLYRKLWVYRYFERLGIPGPKPHWLFGNLLEMTGEGDLHLKLAEWSNKYGSIYGYYEGPSPTLVISDPDMVTNVFVKQFGTFHARKMYHFQPDPDDPNDIVSVFFARGERWKRLRTIINPAFSSKKLRQMTPNMMTYQNNLIDLLKKRANETKSEGFNIFDCFQLLTLDTIGECAFGIELNSIKSEGKDNGPLNKIKEMFEMTFKIPKITILTMIFTELKPLFEMLVDYSGGLVGNVKAPMNWLYEVIEELIAERQNLKETPQDLLQMMLDLESNDNKGKSLSKEEIKAQVFIFLIAGYETSSNTLGFATNLLAMHPECQEKLIKEIDDKFVDGVPIDYDNVNSLKYLDAVVNETLRLFPVAGMVTNRMTMEETQIGGYRIPKGLPVQADIHTLHFDKKLWGPTIPNKFYPERWLPDYQTSNRPDASFMSFGFGPRLCVGYRFAMLEMKLTLVNVLRKFTIERCTRTEPELELKVAHTMTPKNGVWVRLVERC